MAHFPASTFSENQYTYSLYRIIIYCDACCDRFFFSSFFKYPGGFIVFDPVADTQTIVFVLQDRFNKTFWMLEKLVPVGMRSISSPLSFNNKTSESKAATIKRSDFITPRNIASLFVMGSLSKNICWSQSEILWLPAL